MFNRIIEIALILTVAAGVVQMTKGLNTFSVAMATENLSRAVAATTATKTVR